MKVKAIFINDFFIFEIFWIKMASTLSENELPVDSR